MMVSSMKAHLLEEISWGCIGILPLIRKKLLSVDAFSVSPFPLSSNNYHALFLLHERGHSTVSELSRELKISRPNMTPVLDKLVKYDLVSRRSSKEDRRVVKVEITEEGNDLVRKITERSALEIRERVSSLPEKDLERMCGCLHELKTILFKLDHSGEIK